MMQANDLFTLIARNGNAHNKSIYTGVWASVCSIQSSKKMYVVTGGVDCIVKVWAVKKNKLLLVHSLRGHKLPVSSIVVSPDGNTIVSVSFDSTIIVWDLTAGIKISVIPHLGADVWKMAFSPFNDRIAIGGQSGKIQILDVTKTDVIRTIDTMGKMVMCLVWSYCDKLIAMGSDDGNVYVFESVSGRLERKIEGHTGVVSDVTFSPNSELVASVSEGRVKVYDMKYYCDFRINLDNLGWVTCVRFSHKTHRIVVGSDDGSVYFMNMPALPNDLKLTIKKHTDRVCAVRFSPKDDVVLSVSKDGSINLYQCPK